MKNINTNLIFKISSNAEFEDLAYKIFEYQFQNNEIYNKYASLILKEKHHKKSIKYLYQLVFSNRRNNM